jgi:hypothetical protein
MRDAGAKRGAIARLIPIGAIFVAWLVLDEISMRGRSVAPNVIGAGWFQRGAAVVLALVLATGWLVALRGALRVTGRARLVSAAAALVFAAICGHRVALSVFVGDSSWEMVAALRARPPKEDEQIAKMIEHAFSSPRADARRISARFAYRLLGYRIVYKDEDGVPRLYEPPPDDVKKYESTHRAKEETRALLAWTAEQAKHIVWIAYAYLFGLAVMLVGSVVITVRARRGPPVLES